jgi:acyl carrier protein
MDIENKVIELIAGQLNIKSSDVTTDKKILEDLGADSLDVVEMLMALEEEFGVNIPTEEATNLVTVGDVINAIASKAN